MRQGIEIRIAMLETSPHIRHFASVTIHMEALHAVLGVKRTEEG